MKEREYETEGLLKQPGVVVKTAQIDPGQITPEELAAINAYAIHPLSEEEIFAFKAVICDNELDRQYERFSEKALRELAVLFRGKPVIKDHQRRVDNQVARIYDTEVVMDAEGRVNSAEEVHCDLVAKMYMLRTEANEDLIREICAGIKREGSVGCAVSSAYCSICGTDNTKTYCPHMGGKTYKKHGGHAVCTFLLDGGRDAYEFSLVAVPAQRAAGVRKAFDGKDAEVEDEDERERVLALRLRMM